MAQVIAKLYTEKDGKFILDVDGTTIKNDDKDKIPLSRLNQEIEKRKATIQQDILQPENQYQITTRQGTAGIIKKDILDQNKWVIEP